MRIINQWGGETLSEDGLYAAIRAADLVAYRLRWVRHAMNCELPMQSGDEPRDPPDREISKHLDEVSDAIHMLGTLALDLESVDGV